MALQPGALSAETSLRSQGPVAGAGAASAVPAVLARLRGQRRVQTTLAASLAAPVHAYLFLGPPGTGKREAAVAFGAALVCPSGGCGTCPSCGEALSGRHPDVVVVERSSSAIRVDEARSVAALAQRAPRAARYQVLVLEDFHLVEEAAPALLKTIEEPPASTIFVVLAERVPPALGTIASRCVELRFSPLSFSDVAAALEQEGVPAPAAAQAATASGGRLDRARLLAADPGAGARGELWSAALDRLDGTGSTVVLLAAQLLAACDEVVEVVRAGQAAALAALDEAARASGERRAARPQALEDQHRREQRRARVDELRAGLAQLARSCRDRAVEPAVPPPRTRWLLEAARAIDEAGAVLVRNPNESLLLQALLSRIDRTTP